MAHKTGSAASILEVAARLFSEKGYANVSIRDVCREANVSPPMIYYYFKDKKGLFEAAVSHRVSMGDFVSLLRAETKGNDAAKNVETFIDLYLTSFPTQAFEPGLYMMETAKLEDTSAARISDELDEVNGVAALIIDRGIRAGSFRRTDPQAAAECLMGMLNHVIFQQFHFSKSSDIAKSKRFITDFFLRAMKS